MYFAVVYRPGPAWLEGKTVWEQPLKEHCRYMQGLFNDGRVILGGSFTDLAGDCRALAVLKAETQAEADALAASDPAVLAQIAVVEVHPWQLMLNAFQPVQ